MLWSCWQRWLVLVFLVSYRARQSATVFFCTILVVSAVIGSSVQAAQTIPYKINFQGRLTDNNGNVLADGLYNIKFRLYDAAGGGNLKWSEDRIITGVDRRVQITNGLFSVQFGDVSVLSPALFSDPTYPLYLEVELPTPATATCATNGCAVFTEGPMTPRQALASAAYAFNTDTLDGLDSSQYVQLAQGLQVDSSTTNASIAINKTGATANILQIQRGGVDVLLLDNSGTALFRPETDSVTALQVKDRTNNVTVLDVDTTNQRVGIGTAAPTTRLEVGANGAASEIITVKSQATAALDLQADTDNTGGAGSGAYVKLSGIFPGLGYYAFMGQVPTAGQDPAGGVYTGTLANSTLLGTSLVGFGGASPLHLGTRGVVRLTVRGDSNTNAGNIGIGTTAPTALLHVVGTQPATSAATGASSINGLTVTTAAGGETTSTAGSPAGNGGAVSISSGNGGLASGASGANTGGNAGAFSLTAGNGGSVSSSAATPGNGGTITLQSGSGGGGSGTSANGNAGNILLLAGAAGSGGSGAAGTAGSVVVRSQTNNTSAFQIQNAASTALVTASTDTASPALQVTSTASSTQKALVVNNSTSTGNILEVQDNGSAVLTVADGGVVTLGGVPAASATSSLLQLTAAIAGGSANGTYIGANPVSFNGDFINLQVGGSTRLKVNGFGDITSGFTVLDGSSTTNGSAAIASTSMTLTSAASFDVGNYIRLDNGASNCSSGVTICYAKITAKATNTLTITPALTWGNAQSVTEYHVPEIGGVNLTQSLINRFGRGYFIGGVVTGNGSTEYTDGAVVSTAASFDLLNTDVTTLNIGGAATSISLGASGATITLPGSLTVTGALTAPGPASGTSGHFSRSGTTLSPATSGDSISTSGSIATTGTGSITAAGDLAVNGADITTTSTGTASLFDANASSLNIGGAATTLTIGSTTGTLNLRNPTIETPSTSLTLFNTTATSINFGGAATSLSIGSSGGTVTLAGDLAVNGADITTASTGTAALFNANASILNMGGAATAINIGAAQATAQLKVGTPGSATLANANIVVANSEVTTTLRVGTATNGVEFSGSGVPVYRGSARPSKHLLLSPEYPGAVFSRDGSSSTTGTLTSDSAGSGSGWRNYYDWTSLIATNQDYTIITRVTLPADFDSWETGSCPGSTCALEVYYQTGLAATTNNGVSVTVNNDTDTPGTAVCTIAEAASTTWTSYGCTEATLNDAVAPEWDAAGETAVIRIKLKANSTASARARVGDIVLRYKAKF